MAEKHEFIEILTEMGFKKRKSIAAIEKIGLNKDIESYVLELTKVENEPKTEAPDSVNSEVPQVSSSSSCLKNLPVLSSTQCNQTSSSSKQTDQSATSSKNQEPSSSSKNIPAPETRVSFIAVLNKHKIESLRDLAKFLNLNIHDDENKKLSSHDLRELIFEKVYELKWSIEDLILNLGCPGITKSNKNRKRKHE